jgi:hypothetical protein
MRRDEENFTAESPDRARIEARADSIVDLLLSLSDDATEEEDAVSRAVANRRLMELANRMRSVIGE